MGTGWSREEMRNHGTDPRTRGSLMNERLAAIKEIWTKDEAEFHGTYVDFDPVFCWPKPVQRPHPPSKSAATARGRWPGWRRTATAGCRTRWATRVRSQLNRLAEVAGDVPVMVASVSPVPELVAAYAEAGADRVALTLPTAPEAETLRMLDALAVFVGVYQ